jgi:hypothetical protein
MKRQKTLFVFSQFFHFLIVCPRFVGRGSDNISKFFCLKERVEMQDTTESFSKLSFVFYYIYIQLCEWTLIFRACFESLNL